MRTGSKLVLIFCLLVDLLPGLNAAPVVAQPAAQAEAPARRASLVTAVGPIGFTVSDLDASVDFFTGVLEFEKVWEKEVSGAEIERLQGVFGARIRIARLRLGGEEIELSEYLAPRGRPIPADARSNDLWFQHIAIVVADMDAAYKRLRQNDVGHVSTGPQRLPDWNPNAGGIEAFYFRDADSHNLELIYFPPGKGDPRWQTPGDRLFLGIDHSALAVSDTEASLAFYRDALGLEVAGDTLNYGIEQERLNNVFGARVRITGLRAAAGPGIEFLEYLAPSTGRPAPTDLQANDLAHWQTSLTVRAVDEAAHAVRAAGGCWVSPGRVDLGESPLHFAHGALVRDPDGHGLRLVER